MPETSKEVKVTQGRDVVLSVGGGALAYETSCKITTTTELGERITKEPGTGGKYKEKYVKSFSESISGDGFVSNKATSYSQLKSMQLAGEPVDVSYAGGGGKYFITSLEMTADAGDDAKFSVQLESTGNFGGGATQEG